MCGWSNDERIRTCSAAHAHPRRRSSPLWWIPMVDPYGGAIPEDQLHGTAAATHLMVQPSPFPRTPHAHPTHTHAPAQPALCQHGVFGVSYGLRSYLLVGLFKATTTRGHNYSLSAKAEASLCQPRLYQPTYRLPTLSTNLVVHLVLLLIAHLVVDRASLADDQHARLGARSQTQQIHIS